MKFLNFFLPLIIHTFTFSMRMKYSNANSDQITSEFFSDDPAIRFENLAVDENAGWVYVGASNNHLYQLSADLKSRIEYTSMAFNAPNCTTDDWTCHSILLELDYHNQQLIACHLCNHSRIFLEVCRAHNISNISEILANATEYTVFGMYPVFFVAPSFIQNSSALYYGIDRVWATPKITIRYLGRERFLLYEEKKIMNNNFDYVFIYGFNSGDFSYFLDIRISLTQMDIYPKVPIEVNLNEIRHEGQNYQFNDVALTCSTSRQKLINDSMRPELAYYYEHKSDPELKTNSHEIEGKILFTVFNVHVLDRYKIRKVGFKVCACNMSNIFITIQKRRELNGEIIYNYVGNINVTSIAVHSINNYIVLFIGTDKGHLQKISIKLDSTHAFTTNIYADITIDEGSPINSRMLLDFKNNFLYAMTHKKLARIKIHNCDEYSTSHACLVIKDPYCGWCFPSNSCCLKSECHNEKNPINWISYDIDKYVNTYFSPRNKFSRKTERNATFNLLNSCPFNNQKIICSFRFNNTIINTTTSVSNENKINCLTPNPKDLPPIPINERSIKAELSLQTNLFPEFQKIEVEFFDCSTYKSCTECAWSPPCNWHINEQKCADEAIQNSNDTIPGDYFNRLGDYCPYFYRKFINNEPLYIPANTGKKERITATFRIPKILINETFTCEFDTEENKTITSARRLPQRNRIECDDTIFTYVTPKSSITVKWSILWNGSKPVENLHNDDIILYKCANIGNRCAECLNKNYKCIWNSKTGECKYNSFDVDFDHNNHWLSDMENCLNVSFVAESIIKNQTNWLTDNIYWIIIIIMAVTVVTVAVFFIYCRNSAKRSRKMQQQLNKMGMEMIAVSQWVKRVVVENEMELDENESNMLKLPNVTIQYTSIPRFARNESAPKNEYELPADDKWEILRKNIVLGKCLGEGQFGKVVEAKVFGLSEQDSVETVSVKMLKNSHTDADMVNLVTEMQLMKLIGRHENVLRLLGCCTIDGPTLLITEYSSHGNLLYFLQKHHHPTTAQKVKQYDLSEDVLITFALQIAKGMTYLASIGFVHRDLAARNILVFDNYVMKIADFGLARDIRQADYYRLKTGGKLPLKWMAPEALTDRRHTSKSDVWSFGVLLWELMTLGDDPYPLYNDAKKLMDDIESGYRLKKPANCSINTYCLMCKCWNYFPTDRPEFTNIIKDLDAILMNFDKTIEQPHPPSSNYTSTTESDDTDDETNSIEQPHHYSSNYTIQSDNTDDETNDLLKNCIEIE